VGNLVMPPADASALPRIKSAKNAPGKRRNQTSNKWENIHEYGGREAWINAEPTIRGTKWDERRTQAWFRAGRRFFWYKACPEAKAERSVRSTGELFHVEHSVSHAIFPSR